MVRTKRTVTLSGRPTAIPLMPAEPFVRWVTEQVRAGALAIDSLHDADARAIRRLLAGETVTIGEHIVERIGIRVLKHPRLAVDLYPHLAEPVCSLCRVKRCWHIAGNK